MITFCRQKIVVYFYMFCWPENKPLNMFFKLESQTCSFNRFPSDRLKLKWNYVWFMTQQIFWFYYADLKFTFNSFLLLTVDVCVGRGSILLQIDTLNTTAFLCHSCNRHNTTQHNTLSLTNRKEEKRTSPGILWIYDPDLPQKHEEIHK